MHFGHYYVVSNILAIVNICLEEIRNFGVAELLKFFIIAMLPRCSVLAWD